MVSTSAVSAFDEALMSNEKAADWVRNNVMEFARRIPEIMVGDVLVAAAPHRGREPSWRGRERQIDNAGLLMGPAAGRVSCVIACGSRGFIRRGWSVPPNQREQRCVVERGLSRHSPDPPL
jgi:hypothetical protein